jgi:hypothetical protein
MNSIDSILFMILGAALEAIPRMFPGSFPHVGSDIGNSRALWLEFMGAVQIGLGISGFLSLRVLPALRVPVPIGSEASSAVPCAGAAGDPSPRIPRAA